MSVRPVMVGLGELLWDFLPSGRVLGGAPANFAYMTQILGNQGIVASRVGDDELGVEAIRAIEERGMESHYLQLDRAHRTGTASVMIESDGQPQFTIAQSVAWDFLEWTPEWEELSSRTDVVCFGSLAQRSSASAAVVERFLLNAPETALCICDANLREPFYTIETLRKSFRFADVLKLNEAELMRVAALLGITGQDEQELATNMLREFDLELVCLTRGRRGSLIVSEEMTIGHVGVRVEVTDAVGAGDAFTACVAHYYLKHRPLEEISNAANNLAAWVATQAGATPAISRNQLERILDVRPDEPEEPGMSAKAQMGQRHGGRDRRR